MPLSKTGPGAFTRRDFIHRVSRYGSTAVLGSLFGLDLLARDPGDRGSFRLEGRAPGKRRRVIVIGGGVAGLCSAYQLKEAGYDVLLLEARSRPGGRCWTVRADMEETELTGERQVCRFVDGQYLNAGPMRIAHHHATTLGYCREFGVPLTAFTNFNQAAYIHRRGQPRRRIREVTADVRGYTAELLAKVARQSQLDAPLTGEDRDRLIEYLRAEGRLDGNLRYARSGDTSYSASHLDHLRGYQISPGAEGGPGAPIEAVDLETLIKGGYFAPDILDNDLNQQPTMLTPIGGMDRLPRAFAARLASVIRYESEVVEIRRTSAGAVRVVSVDHAHGGTNHEDVADFCICAAPFVLLQRIPSDFSPSILAALRTPKPDTAGKIGLQFARRFWEEDDDIYGGRSLTDDPITQIYYPSEGFGTSGPALLIGSYHFSDQKAVFDLPPAERERLALEQGGSLHPQYAKEFQSAFSVEWHRIRHSEMSWAAWGSNEDFARGTRDLAGGDPPFYFAGDWMSHLNGWQAGALISAHQAVRAIHLRALAS